VLGRAVAEIEFAMKKMLITKLDTYFNLVIFLSLLLEYKATNLLVTIPTLD